jgi:hypothetical protein
MNTIQSGNRTQLTGATAINHDLSTAFYDIGYDPMSGYYLEHRAAFTLPDKIYGDCPDFSFRVIKTFTELKRGMSVLLSGPKGCGKTLTAKQICIGSSMPVICVNAAHSNEGFKTFLSNIPNPCIVFIDEFEKVYGDEDNKNSMLSLLDGTTHNKHLFLLTSNNSDIGKYFNNRPGRVRYHKRFEEFPEIALHQMIDDKVSDATLNKELHKYVETSGAISPDAISCLIEECLIHNETPDKFKDIINIQSIDDNTYSAVVTVAKVALLPDLNEEFKEKGLQYLAYSEGNRAKKKYMLEQIPDIATYAQYTKIETVEYISLFCKPFSDYSYNQEISINYAYCEETNERDSFDIQERDIIEMKKSKGSIYIKTKKLEAKLTKTKTLNIFAY